MTNYPVPVVRIILEDPQGRILFLKRTSKKHGHGKWALPGGKIEHGKTAEQTSIEELSQETNLNISNLEFLFYRDDLPIPGETDLHCLGLYFIADYSGELRINRESSEARWIFSSEFSEYDIAFRHDKAVEKYLSMEY